MCTNMYSTTAVTWLNFCRVGVKLYPINQSINRSIYSVDINAINDAYDCIFSLLKYTIRKTYLLLFAFKTQDEISPCRLNVDWMLAEWRLHNDGKGGFQLHFSHNLVTIQSTEIPLLMFSECVSLSVNLYRQSGSVRIRGHVLGLISLIPEVFHIFGSISYM